MERGWESWERGDTVMGGWVRAPICFSFLVFGQCICQEQTQEENTAEETPKRHTPAGQRAECAAALGGCSLPWRSSLRRRS